jgi:hypothetical protein
MFKRLEQRWDQRWSSPEPTSKRIQVSESATVVGCSADGVWAFVHPAENAVLIEEDVVRAFTVPRTGPGVGEKQCFVRSVIGHEEVCMTTVVAMEEGKYCEAVNGGIPLLAGTRTSVEDVEGGSLITLTSCLEGTLHNRPGPLSASRTYSESMQPGTSDA